jgi:hypothetical protein
MNSSDEALIAQLRSSESRPLYSKIIGAIRKRGWRGTPSAAILYVRRFCLSFWYDLVHGVSTRHKIPLSKLDLGGDSARYALSYEASDTHCLRKLFRSLNIEYGDFEFVDLGAGKGRTLLVAAEFPFLRIRGAELSPALSEAARRNCQVFRSRAQTCKNFEITCGDAAEFLFPKTPLVIYLFNPFGGTVLSRVLKNLERSWSEQPRDIFVIYLNAVHSHLLMSSPFFGLVESGTDRKDYRSLRYMVFRSKPATAKIFIEAPGRRRKVNETANAAQRSLPSDMGGHDRPGTGNATWH